jgi:hypothetical protein
LNNPFLAFQENASHQIVAALDQWRVGCEAFAERMFLSLYGSSVLQAGMGIDPETTRPLRKAAKSPMHRMLVESRIADLKSRVGSGGIRTCVVRSALYVGMSRGVSADERSFELIRRIRDATDATVRLPLSEFKALVREQYFMLLIDEEAALAAIPSMLPASIEERQQALTMLREMLSVRGEATGDASDRLNHVVRLFDVEELQSNVPRIGRREATTKDEQPLAS